MPCGLWDVRPFVLIHMALVRCLDEDRERERERERETRACFGDRLLPSGRELRGTTTNCLWRLVQSSQNTQTRVKYAQPNGTTRSPGISHVEGLFCICIPMSCWVLTLQDIIHLRSCSPLPPGPITRSSAVTVPVPVPVPVRGYLGICVPP